MSCQTSLLFSACIALASLGCDPDSASTAADPATHNQTSSLTAGPPFSFGEITYGFLAQFHDQNGLRQDVSGAAADRPYIVLFDDGGKPSDYNFVRVIRGLPDEAPVELALSLPHKDLEAATWYRGHYVGSTSLSKTGEENAAYRWLTRFTLNHDGDQLIGEESVDLRADLMEGLRTHFGDAWFARVENEPSKSGGLNIEGISRGATGQDALVWGLRSPLFGDTFGNPATDPELSLFEGDAIIAKVADPFGDNPSFTFETLDLEGLGIRGMEWVPRLRGYVIISGPVPKGDGYGLWLWREHDHQLERLELAGFDSLCRPETVISMVQNGKGYLVVMSEESGAACNDAPFTYIQAEIVRGNGH